MAKTSAPRQQAFWLFKNINKAIREFDMIRDGDRIGVAVSGGKDSLSLLRLLDWRRQTVPEKYEVIALHVIGDARGPACPPHPPLVNWLAASGYEYAIKPLITPADETFPMNCQRCAWNRRRTLFQVFRDLGCNVIAFGHHADDLAQTTLLNLFYSGQVETMTPLREYFDGNLRLIRPLCFTPEKDLRRFARATPDFPPPPPECPQSDHSKRAMAREMIWQAGKFNKQVRANLLRAGLRGNQNEEN